MTYFQIQEIKDDLMITDDKDDIKLLNWGTIADGQVDDMLYEIASKNRKIASLPVLPINPPPPSVIGAANDMVKRKYALFNKNYESAKNYKEDAELAITGFVDRLKVDREIYGRILH